MNPTLRVVDQDAAIEQLESEMSDLVDQSLAPAEPQEKSEFGPLQIDILTHTVSVNRHFLVRLEHDMARLRTEHLMLEGDLVTRLDVHRRETAAREKELLGLIAQNKAAMGAALEERSQLIKGINLLLDTIDPKATIDNEA